MLCYLNKWSAHSLPLSNWYYVQSVPETCLGGNAYGFESPVLNTDKMWDICHSRSRPHVRMLTSPLKKKERFLFFFLGPVRQVWQHKCALLDLGEISWLMKPLGRHMNAMSMRVVFLSTYLFNRGGTWKSTLPFLQVLWGTTGFV